ncbi:MAG: YbaK/EbsC family protein [Acidimicrobiia bacterium]|nr:YbaK/EbsC family protein [Acidimicrobiia bacterium]
MPVKQLRDFLDSNHVRYETISHSPAYTAQEIAAATHISGREIAKTVILKIDGELAMMVLPASQLVDLRHIQGELQAQSVELATEKEFKDRFPDCETGAMPPFGHLYNMKLFSDHALSKDQEIAFNAGNHRELIKLSYDDFVRLAQPKILRLCTVAFA